ncbi:MAG: translation initiation factor IF-2 subunit beta [Vulcanisaeta sp.]|jgi:translation initiation factor 2 subunit 2|nr:translation initiation factor IF-2 subunit beta [Vulcanisaeta sp.]MCG2870080.1 translation initiation factor IF-2 subunit beta [Vulcanisaeta sp.]MCG2879965.1 translation initiation factor IF-2 subunit beta [Vulcanisaeta sp.]MCG2887189.1 translation initiation factor IF-2 subunit beta [Vulcanisaeta sp.]
MVDGGYDELYLKLLDRAYAVITPKVERRRELPKLSILVQPKKTIIQNFREVAERLNRDPTHIARFFLKELALPGNIEGNALVLYAERSPRTLEAVYERYIKLYVECPVCHSIDTYLVKEGRIYVLVCTACGARTPRKGIS